MTTEGSLPVDAGAVMLFARALGDDNPIYRGAGQTAPTQPREVVAPPTFVESVMHFDPECRLRPHPGETWRGSAAEPTGTPDSDQDGPVQLHAEQHYEYHRPLRAGTRLTFRRYDGRSWEKTNRVGKTLGFSERITEFRDPADELVVTVRSVIVQIPGEERD